MGVVRGEPVPDWEADYDVEGSSGEGYVSGVYVDSITLDRPSFECRVCGLNLYGAILDLTAIDTTFKRDDDFVADDADTYFNRQLYDDDDN